MIKIISFFSICIGIPRILRVCHQDPPHGSTWIQQDPPLDLYPPGSTSVIHHDPPLRSSKSFYLNLPESTTWINQDPSVSTRITHWDPTSSTTRVTQEPPCGSTKSHHMDSLLGFTKIHHVDPIGLNMCIHQ